MDTVCLTDLAGLWRRTLIQWPGDPADTETEVFWLQSLKHYADLRIPQGRPDRRAIACLRDLDWDMLRFMARQEGFIGHLDVVHSTGQWHRAFDYQPDRGVADRGALSFQGNVLVERGVDLPYVEHWVREPQAGQDTMALWLGTNDSLPIGCLMAAGDFFMYARSRVSPLPRNTTLRQLVDESSSITDAQNLFDCEISFGRVGNGHWRIERSSLPFREGHGLAPIIDSVPPMDPARGMLVVGDVTAEGAAIKRIWHIAACESSRPFDRWFGSEQPLDPAALPNTAPAGPTLN